MARLVQVWTGSTQGSCLAIRQKQERLLISFLKDRISYNLYSKVEGGSEYLNVLHARGCAPVRLVPLALVLGWPLT